MSLKRITSLVMLWSMLLMTYTGIALYIAPHGRVANWTNWTFLGWSKDQFGDVHTTFMVLFIMATILHIYYNIKPLTNYMKDRLKGFAFFTKDMIAALAVTFLFLFGTLYWVTPFSSFLDFKESVKESWVEKKDEPPFGHAEELSLSEFSTKMDYEIDRVVEILKTNNIDAKPNDTLEQLAAKNGITASKLYDIISKDLGKKKVNKITGLGRKNFAQIAKELDMPVDEFLKRLEEMGIKASKGDKFRSTVEKQGFSPREVIDEF